MKTLKNAVIVLAMVLSMVFLSEAVSYNNPLSVKAQSTQYVAKTYNRAPRYRRPYKPSRGYCYRVIKVKKCYWVRVRRCRWVTRKIRIPCPRYPRYRKYRKNY